LVNDYDPQGNLNLGSVTVVSAAAHGTTSVNTTTGVITYTPAHDFSGTDQFSYQVCDLTNLCSQALVNVTVTAVNDAPVATNDTRSTNEDTPVTISITGNDTDVDGTIDLATIDLDPSTAGIQTSVTDSGGNQWSVNSSGIVTFTPSLNFNGIGSLNYTVKDNSGAVSNIATITVTVIAVNDPPVALNDNMGAALNTPTTANVLANDYDPDGNLSATTVTVVTAPLHGTTSVNATTGAITYTPNTGYYGVDSYVYRVCDTSNACAQATVNIQIPPVAPVAVNDAVTVNEETPVAINVVSNDYDPQGDFNYSSVTVVGAPLHGTTSVNASTGVVTYTPASNYTGTDQFTYQVCDLTGFCSQAIVNITVLAVNDAPVAVNDVATVKEDGILTGTSLLGNDSDPDGNTLAINTIPVSGPTHGTLVINANGTYTYTPVANYNGTDSFTYQVCDNGVPSMCSTATVTIAVAPVNDGPRPTSFSLDPADDTPVSSVYKFTTPEDTPYNNVITATDADGDLLSFSSVGTPSHGTLTVTTTGAYSYVPDPDYTGTDNFTVVLTDGNGGYYTVYVKATVTPVNDLPVAAAVPVSTPEDTPVNGTVTATDKDGDPLTFTKASDPVHGTVIVSSNGTYQYIPAENYHGADSFNVTVSDGKGGITTVTVNVTVTPENDLPVAIANPVTTPEDTPIGGTVTATDLDGDALTFGKASDPANGTVIVSSNGTYYYTPAANFVGTDSFKVTVSDGKGGTTTVTVNVTVTPVNDPPVAAPAGVSTPEDTPVSGKVMVTDPDGDPLTFSKASDPKHGTVIVNADGTYTYTPAAGYNGSDSFTVKVSDGKGGTITVTVNVTVTPVNDAPVVTASPLVTPEDTPVVGSIKASDPDGDPLTYTKASDPAHGTVTMNANGTYIYTPAANYFGPDSFTVTVSDGKGGLTLVTVNITVTPVNDPPIAVDDKITTYADIPVTGNLLTNDSDPEGDQLVINTIPATPPANGILVINPDGSFSYTPNPGFTGTDSFVYQVCDKGTPAMCDLGIVTMSVEACTTPAKVSGHVMNGQTPLSGVPVVLIPQVAEGSTTEGARLLITGADGAYSFDKIPAGNYLVQILDANLNSARNLFNINSSLFFVTFHNCDNIVHDYFYGTSATAVLGDFVWLDINNNQLQDEWFDANNDGKVTKNVPDANGNIDLSKWEWLDLNNDGSYVGSQNEGELNRCGFGQNITSNVLVTGPGGFSVKIIVSIDGHWRTRPTAYGEYQSELIIDQPFIDAAQKLFNTGLCKPLSAATKKGAANKTIMEAPGSGLVYNWTASIGKTKGSVTSAKPVNFDLDLATYGKIQNLPPVVADIVKATDKNITFVFAQSDFTSKFVDPDNDKLDMIKIESLPPHGKLVLSGNDVSVGLEILLVDLGKIQFIPDKDYTGETSFRWSGNDGKTYSVSPANVNITIIPSEVFIPDAFTPNGDGINDYFVIKGADRYIVTLRVFNRWGNKVFESTHYQNDWDGTSNVGILITSQLPGGTYYYTANFNNGEKEKIGYVVLVR